MESVPKRWFVRPIVFGVLGLLLLAGFPSSAAAQRDATQVEPGVGCDRAMLSDAGLCSSTYPALAALRAADPALIYSSYLGGEGGDGFLDVTTDKDGDIYAAGYTGSQVPVTDPLNPGTTVPDPGTDAFVAKIDVETSEVVYVKIFGGSEIDFATALVVNAAEEVIVVGSTDSADFPVQNALFGSNQGSCPGEDSDCAIDGFFTKLDAAGEIQLSSYFGGSELDQFTDVALDSQERPVLSAVTTSPDLPLSERASQTSKLGPARSPDAYVASLSADMRTLRSGTYLGGGRGDSPSQLLVSKTGRVVVTGGTESRSFPGSARSEAGRGWQVFLTKLSPAGRILTSRVFGGSGYDFGIGVASTRRGLFVAGVTKSAELPGRRGPDSSLGGGSDGFVTRLRSRSLNILSSRYLGGRRGDLVVGIAATSRGNLVLTGQTGSPDFPIKSPIQPERGGPASCSSDSADCDDAFVTSIRPRSLRLNYSTYIGGSSYDAAFGIVTHGTAAHAVGTTDSSDFPLVRPSQSTLIGASDGVLVTIDTR